MDKERKCVYIGGKQYEECSAEEWDREGEFTREFIDFGRGYTFARLSCSDSTRLVPLCGQPLYTRLKIRSWPEETV